MISLYQSEKFTSFSALVVLFVTLMHCYNPVYSQSSAANKSSSIGMNLGSISPYCNEYAFQNILLQGSQWAELEPSNTYWQNRGTIEKAGNVDANGYLKPGINGMMAVLWDKKGKIGGTYVCYYEGTGSIDFISDPYKSSDADRKQNLTLISSVPGRIEFSLNNVAQFLLLRIKVNDNLNPIKNLKLIEKKNDDGNIETFCPEFIENWKYFKTLRFMDWMLTNNSVLSSWSEVPNKKYLIQGNSKPVSFDLMVELCNTLHADGWFCVPFMADDDYITHMARYIRDSLNPELAAYIEYSNEVWNNQFLQFDQSAQAAPTAGITATSKPWEDGAKYYGYRSAQIHNIFEQEFAAKSQAPFLYPITAWQKGSTHYPDNCIMPFYKAQRKNGKVPLAHAIAPYFGSSIGAMANQSIVSAWSVDKILSQLESGLYSSELADSSQSTIFTAAGTVTVSKANAKKWNIPHLIAYEGGQHMVDYTDSPSQIQNLLAAANRNTGMKKIYQKYLQLCRENGLELFCVFNSVSTWGSSGYWGVKEYGLQSRSEAPKYDALLTWSDENRVAWVNHDMFWLDLDKAIPSTPSGLSASDITSTGVWLSWSASTDDLVLDKYFIFQNNVLIDSAITTSIRITNLSASTTYQYYITSVDAAGNKSAAGIPISITTLNQGAIGLTEEQTSICVYPNPASDHFVIKSVTGNGHFQIYNMNGTIMFQDYITSDHQSVNISDFTSGLYIICICCETGISYMKLSIR